MTCAQVHDELMVFNTLSASSKLLMTLAESGAGRDAGDEVTSDIFKV